MQFIPWRYIADWKCTGCGECCKLYSVVIDFHEWLKIVKNYGVEQTASGVSKLFLRRNGDGSCVFLNYYSSTYTCGIQYMKPKACQIWPFKVLGQPKFGYANEASYPCGKNIAFIYADSTCEGIRTGTPTWEFSNRTLKEFVEIALGIRHNQFKTTGNVDPRSSFLI